MIDDFGALKIVAGITVIIMGAITWIVLLCLFADSVTAVKEFIEVLTQILLEGVVNND
jgi:hypothetical protein